jgi:hypothetical protein
VFPQCEVHNTCLIIKLDGCCSVMLNMLGRFYQWLNHHFGQLNYLIRTDPHDDLSLSLWWMVWGFYSWWCMLICFPLIKPSYEDYTEHFSVGLRRKPLQNLLSVILSRRVWWWVFPSCCLSCVCKNLDACNVSFMDMQVLFIPWSCAGLLWVAVVMLMMLLVELDPWLLVLALLLPVACPAPPCAWLPTLPALHLLGAWPAPCCFWSWLSNHVALVLVLVLWCWCCGCCDAGRLGFLVDQFYTHITVLYHPP